MTEILRQKIIKLVRGEEGVALVVTLALFMFLYVSCAGVYAVGRSVKDRIILQNAVDAAAYSAAVVQADYLSRIATINKAMAWTYKELVRSQRYWIAFKTIKESREKYKTDRDKRSDGTIAATIPSAEPGTIGIRGEGVPNPVIDEPKFEDWSDDEIKEKLKKYAGVIRESSGKLDEMIAAVNELQGRFYDEGPEDERITTKVEDVLRANLPARLGELCRYQIKLPMRGDGLLMPMSSDKESVFLQFAGEDDIADFREEDWFPLRPGESFTRSFERLQTYWTYQDRTTHVPVIRDPITNDDGVDAGRDFRDDLSEAFYDVSASPLILNNNYFPGSGEPVNGAITVAVAKWNENPWKGLVTDLKGFYAVFTHAEKNDWTFAVASAQAGYREDENDEIGVVRKYSLNGEDFIGSSKNLSVTDWDALYLPVRKAFGDSGEFRKWLTENSGGNVWDELVADGKRKDVKESLEGIRFDELNHRALSRMHNNSGTDQVLKWDSDGVHDFLDLMYH